MFYRLEHEAPVVASQDLSPPSESDLTHAFYNVQAGGCGPCLLLNASSCDADSHTTVGVIDVSRGRFVEVSGFSTVSDDGAHRCRIEAKLQSDG